MIRDLGAYLPQDRLHALARRETLPELLHGSVLFADVSGFTPLTEALTRALGPHRGAEAISLRINQIYDVLIAPVHRWRGSVVSFSGDAITCWFDDRDGAAAPRAAACALAMQHGMRAFTASPLPDGGSTTITLKVAITTGPARRFVVGDRAIQQIDVLSGSTVARVALVEHHTHPGEILLDQASVGALDDIATLSEWRTDPDTGDQYALLCQLTEEPQTEPWPELAPGAVALDTLQPWVLPAVYERSQAGLGAFLTELRPLVAMFVRFAGIDYDQPDARARLNGFISDVQHALARYDGTLLQITIGDKGSYLYIGFGAPTAHEDDPRRAVLAALALQRIAATDSVLALQIGISQGMLLVGVYGSTARTYAATGDEVNVAARLMSKAEPGEILISDVVQKVVAAEFSLETRPPILLKGKSSPMVIAAVRALRQLRPVRLEEPNISLPLIGRQAELVQLRSATDRTLAGHPQIIGIMAEAGLGKSRLVAEGIRLAHQHGLTGYGSACLATATTTPYFVWQAIWRAFFNLDPEIPARHQIRLLTDTFETLVPERIEALPLLGPLVGLSLDDTNLTRSLGPRDRQQLLHLLLGECLAAAARAARAEGGGLLLVLEDLHWIDAASLALLRDLAAVVDNLPILMLFAYRPPDQGLPLAEAAAKLPHHQQILLDGLDPAGAAQLIHTKLNQLFPKHTGAISEELATLLTERAQGNPFYLEELLNYLHDRNIDPRDSAALARLELPKTLYSLVLSRMDQLSARQQALLKTASVIGRRFLVAWLHGAFAQTSLASGFHDDLEALLSTHLMSVDTPEPELAYLFKHVVTQEVAYTSLSPNTRALLHGNLAAYLELAQDTPDSYLDLLAYHYDRSSNLPKRREYLRRAGQAAAEKFANDAALSYLTRALALVPPEEQQERFDLLLACEQVYDVLAQREAQAKTLAELFQLAEAMDNDRRRLQAMLRQVIFVFASANHQGVIEAVQVAVQVAHTLGDNSSMSLAYVYWAAALSDLGSFNEAQTYLLQALELARSADDQTNEALTSYMMGMIDQIHGSYAAAEDWFMRAVNLYRAAGDRREEANRLRFHAHMLYARGAIDAACEEAKQSEALYHSLGDPEGKGWAATSFALFSCMGGALGEAIEALQRGSALVLNGGLRRSVAYVLNVSGIIYDMIGDYAKARVAQEQALELVVAFRSLWGELAYRSNLAMVAHHQGDHAGAIRHCERAVELGQQYGIRYRLPEALLAKGHAHAALNDWQLARDAYQAAADLYEVLDQQHLICEPRAGLIRVAMAQGQTETARQHLDAILDQISVQGLAGTYDPLLICLTCYEAMAQLAPPRAPAMLQTAYNLLQERAATLTDPATRTIFLQVAVNRRIAEYWAAQ